MASFTDVAELVQPFDMHSVKVLAGETVNTHFCNFQPSADTIGFYVDNTLQTSAAYSVCSAMTMINTPALVALQVSGLQGQTLFTGNFTGFTPAGGDPATYGQVRLFALPVRQLSSLNARIGVPLGTSVTKPNTYRVFFLNYADITLGVDVQIRDTGTSDPYVVIVTNMVPGDGKFADIPFLDTDPCQDIRFVMVNSNVVRGSPLINKVNRM